MSSQAGDSLDEKVVDCPEGMDRDWEVAVAGRGMLDSAPVADKHMDAVAAAVVLAAGSTLPDSTAAPSVRIVLADVQEVVPDGARSSAEEEPEAWAHFEEEKELTGIPVGSSVNNLADSLADKVSGDRSMAGVVEVKIDVREEASGMDWDSPPLDRTLVAVPHCAPVAAIGLQVEPEEVGHLPDPSSTRFRFQLRLL